ncbi:DUF2325 domain-containing protein [Gottfriedia acidiceleris]|uniref:DUF2325 domain-containing protein n=1 Tax=Gottfriedia acidiceleris TaxID=371036 RepID=UPI003397F756
MYLNRVFEEIKTAMIKELPNVTLNNFSSHQEWLRRHHNIIEELVEIMNMGYTSIEVKEDIVSEPSAVLSAEAFAEKEVSEYPVLHTFKFAKKASGGVIEGLNYPLPEELVRTLTLENGNIITITGIKGTFLDGSPIYEFDVTDRTIVPNPDLAEVSRGIVEEISGRLVITGTDKGTIRVDDAPACLYINDKDARQFKIEKGDIIDGRFYTNNVTNSFRVSLKHDTDKVDNTSIEAKKLLHRQNNITETESGTSMIDRLDKTPFLDKKILLVGLESRINDFKLALYKTDEFEFVHLTGDEHKQRIRAQILKADYVVIPTQETSHDCSKYVASICNEYHIPCTSTNADGLFGVLMDVKDLIEKQAA